MNRFPSYTRLFLIGCLTLILGASCASINCPISNSVAATWTFYDATGATSLQDTLYVYLKVNGQDSLIINKLYSGSSVSLPMSYFNDQDTLIWEFIPSEGKSTTDQIIVKKSNITHLDSPECGTWVDHYVSNVTSTYNGLDSIQIINNKVDTNERENFRIYLK